MRKTAFIALTIGILGSCTSNKEFAMLKEKVDKLEQENQALRDVVIRLDERTNSVVRALNNTQPQQEETPKESPIYSQVDKPASYPGGDKALFDFFGKNFKWPDGVEFKGQLEVKFVVEPTGQISNFSFTKAGPEGLNLEIVRVFKLMPRWEPGNLKGQIVRSWFILPITI